jgi:4-diphosphocytidyl-2-C-methyl-D-erythritol kinase
MVGTRDCGAPVTEPLDEAELERPRLGRSGPVRVRVPAKINLHLRVGDLRPDGYHEVSTVYHAVSLYDEITARPGDTLTLTMEGEGAGHLPLDESNLAVRAARLLAEHTGRPAHARLHLRKSIPVAAGLAGGSADAAAALVACDALWNTGFSRDRLADLAADLGSDVPFLVLGGTALGTGRGERVSPVLAPGHTWYWVLAFADEGMSTPQVYAEIDRRRAGGIADAMAGEPDMLLAALRQRDPEVLAATLVNDLQGPAVALRPELMQTLMAADDVDALAGIVSGSGPTCAFLAADSRHAAAIVASLERSGLCRTACAVTGPVAGARVV